MIAVVVLAVVRAVVALLSSMRQLEGTSELVNSAKQCPKVLSPIVHYQHQSQLVKTLTKILAIYLVFDCERKISL